MGPSLTPPGGGCLNPSTRPTACAVGYSLSPFGLGVRRQEPKM